MLLDLLKERFGADLLETFSAHGEDTVVVDRDRAIEILARLRDDPQFAFKLLLDVTVVDWIDRNPRFEVVYHLRSITLGHWMRLKIRVAEPNPWVHTAAKLWNSADWLERECYDMFGIHFEGHPDLRRILMYDSFEGHPLRKDYPVGRRQPIVPETNPVLKPLRQSR